MPAIKKDYVRASASILAGQYRALEKLAERKKVSVAWIIRDAVEKYLELNSVAVASAKSGEIGEIGVDAKEER